MSSCQHQRLQAAVPHLSALAAPCCAHYSEQWQYLPCPQGELPDLCPPGPQASPPALPCQPATCARLRIEAAASLPGVHTTALQKTAVGRLSQPCSPGSLTATAVGASLSYVTCSRSFGGWSAFLKPTLGPQQSTKTPGRLLELHSRCIHPGAGSVSHEGWCHSVSSSASCRQRCLPPKALIAASASHEG